MDTIENLYRAICNAYSSKQIDDPAQMKAAMDMLNEAVHKEKVSPQLLVEKARQYAAITDEEGSIKYKPVNIILSRYWEKSFVKPIKRIKFKPE